MSVAQEHLYYKVCSRLILQFYFLPETGFIRRYLRSGKLAKTFNRSGYSAVINTLEKDEKIGRLNLDLSATLDCALSTGYQLDFSFLIAYLKILRKIVSGLR